jgi:CRISPR type III-B/RAMP module-associated protein Cmr5
MQERALSSPEERAINDFRLVYRLFQEIAKVSDRKDFGKSFRARAREMPSLLYEVGVIPALSFMYAKTNDADKQVYRIFVDFVRNIQITPEDSKKLNSTEGGYAAYLYLTLLEIKRLMPEKNMDPSTPISCIDALIGFGRVPVILPSLLMPYLLEIKRLAEAVFPSE